MAAQPGDTPTPVFSFLGRDSEPSKAVNCFITGTNEQDARDHPAATDRSPMFTGRIEGVGPRYCPSVEDKVVRFADKTSHQILSSPEGLLTHEVYPNGISTSLPFDVQYEFVRTIRGFENAHLTRPGYAIEYGLLRSAGPEAVPRDSRARGSVSSPVRSMARGLRGSGPRKGSLLESTQPVGGRVTSHGSEAQRPYVGVLIRDLVTRGTVSPIECSPAARSTGYYYGRQC